MAATIYIKKKNVCVMRASYVCARERGKRAPPPHHRNTPLDRIINTACVPPYYLIDFAPGGNDGGKRRGFGKRAYFSVRVRRKVFYCAEGEDDLSLPAVREHCSTVVVCVYVYVRASRPASSGRFLWGGTVAVRGEGNSARHSPEGGKCNDARSFRPLRLYRANGRRTRRE